MTNDTNFLDIVAMANNAEHMFSNLLQPRWNRRGRREEGEAHGQLVFFCYLLISLAEFIFMRKGR
jgi:hypothetical protein